MILVYRSQLNALIASASLWIALPASSDERDKSYLRPIELACPSPERPELYLISKNRLSQRDKIEIIFEKGIPREFKVAAADPGNEFTTYFHGAAISVEGKQVLREISIYMQACKAGGRELDGILKTLKENVKMLNLQK